MLSSATSSSSAGEFYVDGDAQGRALDCAVSAGQMELRISAFPDLAFLGQGSMCKCFVARRHHVGQRPKEPVVLKMAIENGPLEAERDLNRELALMRRISHPNLPCLIGSGLTPKGKTFIVMEYLDGGTLRRRLDNARGGLGFWPGIRHALELAAAMRYLHEEAIPDTCIMHRDLKPDNVGFARGVLKVFDFGLAKLLPRSQRGANDLHRMSGEVGSLRYMSPEVASLQPYNEKADVHSFGVVMWETVTGWLPFAGLSPHQYMLEVVRDGRRPLMQFAWDPMFKELLSSCWAESARERPSFAQICDSLEGLLEDKGTQPRSQSLRGERKAVQALQKTPSKAGFLSRLMPGKARQKTRQR